VVEINRPLDLAPPPGARRTATRLDIRATSERRVFIRTNSLDTEWGFDVTIGGTTAEPRVEGTASLVRGDITLAGEVFEFRQSQIVFDGDPRQAQIDFTAQRESADITVTARVTGTAEKPEIALSSSPSYPQDEILARMLFGRTRSDLSPFQAAQLASALASLAGGQGFDLLGPLRETLGVDRLGVNSVDGRALLSGGRYLAEDVYLEVSGGATGLAEAAIEWEIRPRLELATRFGIARDTSVSIRWRKDY
jgi:translocation and assembly module TamB